MVADVKLEHRAARLEVRGRRIAGLAVPWGQRALVPEHGEEVFTSGAFGDDLKPVDLTLEHGGAKIGEVQPANSDRGLEVDGTYSGDLQGRDKFSIDFYARKDTRSQGLRIVHSAELVGLASVRHPIYRDAVIEHRQQGAALFLVEGPVAGGKSEVLRNLLATDVVVDLVADTTPLWAALRLIERDASGNYPERLQGDPALLTALYLKTTTARRALSEGLRVAVSTSTPNQAEKWAAIAREFEAVFEVTTADPGEAVVRERLGGDSISDECNSAVERWYGSRRSAVLSLSRRRLLAATL